MTNAIAGPGFSFQIGDGGSPENFTTVLNVKDIKGGGYKTDVVDITNQSSPGNSEEIIPTLLRTVDITFDVNWDDTETTHNDTVGLQALVKNRTKRNMHVLRPDGLHGWSFAGYVVGFDPNRPVSGVQVASVTVKRVGPITVI